MKRIMATLGLLCGLASLTQAATFTIDPAHSSISFKVKHVVGNVVGKFNKFTGSFTYDPANFAASSAEATLDATSVDTGIEKRDGHLRSADFFDVAKYPTIAFKSDSVSDVQGNKGKLHGQLTMHGVTKPVVLDLEITGMAKDPMGKGQRAGASATGRVSRSDFNLGPASGPMASMVGQDVSIDIEVEGVSK